MESFDSFQKDLDGLDDLLIDDVIINKPKRLSNNPSKKRQRKTKKQMDVLESYFAKSVDWSNATIDEIAQKTGLKSKQVSKWLWDQRIKRKIDTSESGSKTHKRAKLSEEEGFDDIGFSIVNNGSTIPKPLEDDQNKCSNQQININLNLENINKDNRSQ